MIKQLTPWHLLCLAIPCVLCMPCRNGTAVEDRAPIPAFKPWTEVKPEPLQDFPLAQPERFVLPNGMVVFLIEDHELPLVEAALTIRTGAIWEPAEKVGLASITAQVLRAGGSAKIPGDALDLWLELNAASLWTGMGTDSGSAGFHGLKENFDAVFDVFLDLLRAPAFPQEKLDLELTRERTHIAKRNDNPSSIQGREFNKALQRTKDGKISPYDRHTEYETLNAITRADLVAFHKAHFHPGRFILSVTGDFDAPTVRARIEQAFGAWPTSGEKLPEPPQLTTQREARVLFVERPHVNQTAFTMGQVIDVRRSHKDYPALMLLNEVLAGGMSARLFTEVRTKKGLAYSVGGAAHVNYDRPGIFQCACLTRNEQALEAMAAVKAEVSRLHEHGATAKELENARAGVLNRFVFNYDTPQKNAARLRTYEYYGYPLDFDRAIYEGVRKVTLVDVNRVAKEWIDPDRLLLLGVGNSAHFGKPLDALGKVEKLDVSIPVPAKKPLVIDPEKEKQGRQILEAAVRAHGGVEALGALKTVRAELVLHTGTFKLRTVMRAALPEKVRADVAGPLGPVTQIMAPQESWQASGNWVKPLKPEEARKNLRALIQTDLGVLRLLASGQEGYNVQSLDPLRDGGTVLQGVLVESERLGRVKLYFDAETKLLLLLRYSLDGVPKELEKRFSAQRPFGALILAGRIEDNDPKARAHVVEMTDLEVNTALDDALFAKPEKATPPPGK